MALLFSDIIKKHPSYDRILKALKKMPNSPEKTELSKSFYQFIYNSERYYSDIEMQLFYVSKLHYELKQTHEIDQKLIEYLLFDGFYKSKR